MSGLRPLLAPLVLRPLRADRLRFALTAAGIAVGVATIAAIGLSNASVLASFSGTVDAIAGRASLTVLADGPGIPEETVERLAWLREAGGAVVPAVTVTATAGEAPGSAEVVEVLGIDPLADGAVRTLGRGGPARGGARDGLDDLAGLALFAPDAVLVTEAFAARHRLAEDEPLTVWAGARRLTWRVAGVLPARGAARAASGSLLVVDLATAQEAFGRTGWLDRVDVVLPEGLDAAERTRAAEEVAASLGPSLTVGPPERRTATVERMVRAFRVNLTALGLIALLVGTTFVHGTVSISVLARRAEIGTVRALGAPARSVFAVFLLGGAGLGVVGSAAGLVLGIGLARGALAAVGGTATDFFLPAARPELRLAPDVLLLAFGTGVLASVLSALGPAREASRVAPAAAVRRGSVEAARRRATRPLAAAGSLLLLLSWLATRPGPVNGLPAGGFASVFLLVAGVALLSPLAVTVTARGADRLAVRLLGVAARIARANLTGSLSRTSVAVAALALGVSMMVAVAVMVGSFRLTVSRWVGETLRADLFVAPESGRAGRALGRIPEEALLAISGVPGVEAVDPFLSFPATRDGAPYTVGSGRFDVLGTRGSLPMVDGRPSSEVVAAARARGEALVSEPYAERFGVKAGDLVTLPAPAGPVAVRVAGVYTDYSNDRGTVTVDRPLFRRLFGLDGAVSAAVYLAPGSDPETVRRALIAATHGRWALSARTNATLRKDALALFDRTFAITYALEAVAIAVAVLGVFSTLLALVLERQREIGLLRALGASAAQVRLSVRLEAAALAALGTALGIASGAAMAWVLVHVVNRQSFGWTIGVSVPWGFLGAALALVVLATVTAASQPARIAAATDPARALLEE